MAWDAGSIESRLDVDTSPFRRGLDEAKAEAREFADKRYTTTVDIDTRRSNDELAAVEQRLRGIESTIDRVNNKAGGGRGGAGGGFLSRFGAAGNRVPAPSFLGLGIGAAIPAAVPLAGVGLGVGAGAFSALAAGGIGGLAFGAGAKSSITTVQKDVQQLTKLTGQYNAATTDKQRAAVLAKEHTLWKNLDPAQRQAVKNVQGLDASWTRYKKALEPQSFKVLADGSKLATTGLGYLLPVAKATGNEIDVLLRHAETAFKAPFWQQFFGTFLPGEATKATAAFGSTLGNLVTAGAHLVQDFAPLGGDFEHGLVRLSGRFEKWTEGEGPGKFVAFVEKEGPQVATTLGALAQGVAGLGKGLAPIGAVELKALTPILNFIGKLGDEHPAVITAVGAALLTVGTGLKAISLAQGAAGILAKLRGLGGGPGGGGVAGELAGRGSPTNPMYVVVLDKAPPGVPHGGSAVKTVIEDVKKYGPGAAVAGGLLKSRIGSYLVKGATGAADIADPVLLASMLAGSDKGPKGSDALQRTLQTLLGQFTVHGGQVLGPSGVPVSGAAAHAALLGLVPHDINKVSNKDAASFLTADKFGGRLMPDPGPAKREIALLVAALQADAAKGGTSVGDKLNTSLDEAIRRRLAPAATNDARIAVAQIAKNAAQAASQGGESLGESLGDGMAIGILVHKAKVANAAGQLTNAALGKIRQLGDIGSPSKVTIQYGKWFAQGLAIGFTAFTSDVTKAFTGGTAKTLNALGVQLNNAANQYRSDLQARSQAGASIASGLLGNADLSNVGFSNTGGVGLASSNRNLIGRFTQEKTLLAKLRAKHLDPDYLTQIAGMAPDRGIFTAQDILSGAEGSIGSLNKQRQQLRSLTNSIGSGVAGAQFAGTLSRDQRALEHVARSIELLAGKQLRLSHGDMQMLAREIATQIAHVFPTIPLGEIDRALGLKVRAHR